MSQRQATLDRAFPHAKKIARNIIQTFKQKQWVTELGSALNISWCSAVHNLTVDKLSLQFTMYFNVNYLRSQERHLSASFIPERIIYILIQYGKTMTSCLQFFTLSVKNRM